MTISATAGCLVLVVVCVVLSRLLVTEKRARARRTAITSQTERARIAELAVATERNRIVREMHDVRCVGRRTGIPAHRMVTVELPSSCVGLLFRGYDEVPPLCYPDTGLRSHTGRA
ncbi:MAG: hypothetical protein FWH11_02100 [Micrococcales bacterium]|nr:hypothetical protein [Micrococcales bacterium]